MIIGLTGGIGSGKSTVSDYLKEKKDCTIVDADLVSRQVVEPGSDALKEIQETFGSQMIFPDGTLDRKKLGRLVFSDQTQLDRLNAIMSRIIREEITRQLDASKTPLTVLDAATLLESGMDRICDEVWIVDASDEVRIQRVMKRDDATEEEVRNRMKAQMSREARLNRECAIIDNSGSVVETCRQVDKLLARIAKQWVPQI